jgi:hypothetical protein
MTVRVTTEGIIALEGTCVLEDAESLHQYLLGSPEAIVDWRECDQAHSAVIQILMAFGNELRGPPRGEFLKTRIDPAVRSQRG